MELISEGFTAEIYRWGEGLALKLYRPMFEEVAEREFEIMRTLSDCGLRIPRVIRMVEVDGRPGYLMDEIRGTSFRELLESDDVSASRIAATLGKLHASVHDCKGINVPLGSIRDRVVDKVLSADALGDLSEPARAALDSVSDGTALCHNDFHFGNVLQGDDIVWMIDWNGAGLGDPHADLGKSTVLMGHGPEGICFGPCAHNRRIELTEMYLEAYAGERELDLELLKKWQILRAAELISLGVPFADELESFIKSLL
jgi:aminoglycoside phosphotransferase (APT) family kinase protein